MVGLRGACASYHAVFLVILALPLSGCGDEVAAQPTGPMTTEVLTPDAPPLPGQTECRVEMTTNIAISSANHLDICTPIAYETNPPSGGNHWGQWAAFKKYSLQVPREMYVHNMEHGAVVLSYRCTDECPDVVGALAKVFDEANADPLCLSAGASPKARLVLTPDPQLDTPVAASAWGATYTATCIDTDSLAKFVSANYGKGPEATCYQGQDLDTVGLPMCPGT